MAKSTTVSPPMPRTMSNDNKKRITQKGPNKSHQTIVDHLRQKSPTPQTKRRRNDEDPPPLSQRSLPSTAETSELAPMDIEFEFDNASIAEFEQEITTGNDDESVATKNVDNINKQLSWTRVDVRIKVPPHSNPEEKTVQVLQEFLQKLQSFDPTVRFAPWDEHTSVPPLRTSTDFVPRLSELEKYFPRVFLKEEGFTWYSGVRIIHSLPINDLRLDMVRWLKREGHGLFERMLQVANTAEIGWLVYSTWQMEASALAQAIESTINIPVGLRWKQVSNGSRERLPPELQVKALHVEVASENRVIAQKALLAVYGKKNTGQYPNGVRLRFALLIHSAHNLHSKAKLESLRARQQLWLTKYETGFSWEINQLDHPIGKNLPTLRLALATLISKVDPKLPIFHSVDRSHRRDSGTCFQFLPELAEEARMTISNLLPLLQHKYGKEVLRLFSPSAVERMEGCRWDPESESVIGQYDDEITFLDEDDPMKSYIIKPKSADSHATHTTNTCSTTAGRSGPTHPLPTATSTLLQDMDEDSVSTLGNQTHQRWIPTPPPPLPSLLTQRPSPPSVPQDEASLGSISTLTTRLNTMEQQYNQISGAVQDIKLMLVGLAQSNTRSTQDESPMNESFAGRGPTSTGAGS